MQRSVLPPLSASRPRRRARLLGIAAVSSALLLTLGTGAAQAHGNGGRPTPKPTVTAKPSPTAKPETTAAYVYLKADPRKDGSWENSTQQYLITTWPGGYWRSDFTLAEINAALPSGVTVCGNRWAVQQDMAYGDETVFTENEAPFYPDDYIGWWDEKTQTGYIFDADHSELRDVVTESVPRCGATSTPTPTVTPTVTPSPTPVVTPSPTVTTTPQPTPSVTAPAPAAPAPSVSPSPVAEVDDDEPAPTTTPGPSTTPAPSSTPTVAVAASTPTPSASFYSEVLADDGTGGASLAATGSSPLPGVLAGGILVLSGAALLLLRRHRAS